MSILEKVIYCMLGYIFLLIGTMFSIDLSLFLYQLYKTLELGLIVTLLITPPLLFTIIIVPVIFIIRGKEIYQSGGL